MPTLSRIPLSIFSLLFCGGEADIEEHNIPSKVGNEAVGRLTDRS